MSEEADTIYITPPNIILYEYISCKYLHWQETRYTAIKCIANSDGTKIVRYTRLQCQVAEGRNRLMSGYISN